MKRGPNTLGLGSGFGTSADGDAHDGISKG